VGFLLSEGFCCISAALLSLSKRRLLVAAVAAIDPKQTYDLSRLQRLL